MIGEIHLTREIMGRLIRDELHEDERRAILEHLNSSGQCKQCDEAADDPDDDEQFKMLLTYAARLELETLRRRAAAGDPDAERELRELEFRAIMRQVTERKARPGLLMRFHGRIVNLGQRLFGRRE